MGERAIYLVLDESDCAEDRATAVSGAIDCHRGQIYSLRVDWRSCQNSCPKVTRLSDAPIAVEGLDFPSFVERRHRLYYVSFGTKALLVLGSSSHFQAVKTTVSISEKTSDDEIGEGDTYYIIQVANQDKYYFIDASTGLAYKDDDASTTVDEVCDFNGCANVGVYFRTAADLEPFIESDFSVPSGPAPNPSYRCSLEPLFIDGNGNGKLDCNSNDRAEIGGDIAFGDYWQYRDWRAHSDNTSPLKEAPVLARANAYSFGDPAGAKKLLTTAFNGWFDGSHSITETTDLNSLQILSMIYLLLQPRELSLDDQGAEDGNYRVEIPFWSEEFSHEMFNREYSGLLMNFKQPN